MFKEFILLLCLLSLTSSASVPVSQPIETNAAAVAEKITPEADKSNDQESDLETAEWKHFGRRKFIPVAVPVAPVYVQPIAVQPVAVQPIHYQAPHVHTPDCGCNNGGGYNNYNYHYKYHYNY